MASKKSASKRTSDAIQRTSTKPAKKSVGDKPPVPQQKLQAVYRTTSSLVSFTAPAPIINKPAHGSTVAPALTPISVSTTDIGLIHTLTVLDATGVELVSIPVKWSIGNPQTVNVDLTPFAGTTVTIELTAEVPAGGTPAGRFSHAI